MYSTLPVIDFGCFRSESIEERMHIATEVDTALKTVGFFFLKNHGIPQREIESSFNRSQQFFSLPEHEKEKLAPKFRSFDQGYMGIQREKVRSQACMKESFDFGNPDDASLGFWPTETQLPGFRASAVSIYQHCSHLTRQLLECLSLALELDSKESLSQYHAGSMFVSSLIHYPSVPTQLVRSGEVVRLPAHSDLGTLTILFQRDVGGLQVADMSSTDKVSSSAVDKNAKFLDIEPNSETILVNVGYLLMRWTNGRWKNTVHRVSAPPSTEDTKVAGSENVEWIPERYSIAFFSFPDTETTVEPLRSCCSKEVPPKFTALNAGDYLLRKREAVYS